VIYKLEPPRPGTVRGLSAGAGCRREPYQLNPEDDIKIYYATNEPSAWVLLCDDNFPAYASHWSYHLGGAATCGEGARRVFVKYAIRTAASAAILVPHMRVHWLPDGPRGVPERGVRVEHGWTEGGERKAFSKVVTRAPESYVVETGRNVVNAHITLEPVRSPGLAWREDDPPVTRPPVPGEKVLDEKMRDEMRTLLRAVDADPATGLPRAAQSTIPWLADGARQALEMLRRQK